MTDYATPDNLSTFGELVQLASGELDPMSIATFGYLGGAGQDIIPELLPYMPQIKYRDDDYFLMLNHLLPRGYIWTAVLDIADQIINNYIPGITPEPETPVIISDTDKTNVFKRFLSCFGSELARLELQVMELVKESVPGLSTIDGLLPRWEKQYALPDKCSLSFVPSFSQLDRQRWAHAKHADEYKTTNKQFFIDYANTLGWLIDVHETRVASTTFRVGAVDPNPPLFDSPARMGVGRMGGVSNYAVIQIEILSGSTDTRMLECAFAIAAPAHVIFEYIWA